MHQFKKGFLAMGLALVLCANFTLPANAATGSKCPSCGGTNTSEIGNITEIVEAKESCIHGYDPEKVKDTIEYRVVYEVIYCNICRSEKIIGVISRKFLTRTCPIV